MTNLEIIEMAVAEPQHEEGHEQHIGRFHLPVRIESLQ